MARRPPWIFKLPAPLPLELGTEVVSEAGADAEVEEEDSVLVELAELSLDEEDVAVELLSVDVMVIEVIEVIEPEVLPEVVAVPVDVAEPVADPVWVPVAPWIPKLGEKL
jgi:hypothetical protein